MDEVKSCFRYSEANRCKIVVCACDSVQSIKLANCYWRGNFNENYIFVDIHLQFVSHYHFLTSRFNLFFHLNFILLCFCCVRAAYLHFIYWQSIKCHCFTSLKNWSDGHLIMNFFFFYCSHLIGNYSSFERLLIGSTKRVDYWCFVIWF